MNGTDLGCMSLGGGVTASPCLPLNHGTGGSILPEVGPDQGRLTDAGFRAGEAPVLGHHVGVVALAGQHLCHLRGPLPLPHLGLQENPEADVTPIRRELPPVLGGGEGARLLPSLRDPREVRVQLGCGRWPEPHLRTQPGNRISYSTWWEEPRLICAECSY